MDSTNALVKSIVPMLISHFDHYAMVKEDVNIRGKEWRQKELCINIFNFSVTLKLFQIQSLERIFIVMGYILSWIKIIHESIKILKKWNIVGKGTFFLGKLESCKCLRNGKIINFSSCCGAADLVASLRHSVGLILHPAQCFWSGGNSMCHGTGRKQNKTTVTKNGEKFPFYSFQCKQCR